MSFKEKQSVLLLLFFNLKFCCFVLGEGRGRRGTRRGRGKRGGRGRKGLGEGAGEEGREEGEGGWRGEGEEGREEGVGGGKNRRGEGLAYFHFGSPDIHSLRPGSCWCSKL